MRVALISDVHGNLLALEAVLADVNKQAPDQIVCLGDLATFGPHPHEAVQRVMALGCVVIRGNNEDWCLNLPQLSQENDFARRFAASLSWARAQLTAEDLDFLEQTVPTHEVSLGEEVLLCAHGSPRSNEEIILATTPDDEVEPMLNGIAATWVAGGHTHVQMLRRLGSRMFVNPGSVGMPWARVPTSNDEPFLKAAEYALLDAEGGALQVQYHRVPLDVEQIAQAARQAGMPDADVWARRWLTVSSA